MSLSQPPTYERRTLYEFGDTLFIGSFATVKAATLIATGESVTAKIILKKTFEGDIFEKEIGVLKALHHPNIVNFLDWFESNDKHFLILESASGDLLSDALIAQGGKLPERQVVQIVKTILSAITYIHSKNVVHRGTQHQKLFLATAMESRLTYGASGKDEAV
ncbi:hypothetical protein BGZ51_003252 [Haplosporangium sp. Z 767]|nr:hypothetical protein BGZ51_003252 [Haplosporangium sp. Z 767]